MPNVRRNRRVSTNEDLIVKSRYRLSTGEALIMEEGHMRGVMDVDGAEVEIFDVTPTQAPDGWITGYVPQPTMELIGGLVDLPGVARYDMAIQFENDTRIVLIDGTLEITQGISQWS